MGKSVNRINPRLQGGPLDRWVAAIVGLCFLAALAVSPASARDESAMVVDYDSGETLYADDPDQPRFPASLTKMMTLYIAFGAIESGRLDPDTKLRISERAAAMPPTKLGLEPGTAIRVEDAIMGLITRSANDAAAVLAEALGGSEDRFADLMTRTARRLGMASTSFKNASGLPDAEQHTTARDMAALATHLIRDYPRHYARFARTSFVFAGRNINTHNRLLSVYQGADGIKTGYTRAAGYNLVASAVRDGRRLIGVVMGGTSAYSRDVEMASLLDRGFARLGRASRPLLVSAPVIPAPKAPPVADVPVAAEENEDAPSNLGEAVAALAAAQSSLPASKLMRGKAKIASLDDDDAVPARSARGAGRRAAIAAPRPPASPYGVEVGVFRSAKEAQRSAQLAIRRVPSLLRGTFASVSGARQGRRTDYRARLIGLDRGEAQAVCRTLRKYSQSCEIVRTAKIAVAANS